MESKLVQRASLDQVPPLKGRVKIQSFDADSGRLNWEREDHNLIMLGIRDVLGELLVQQSLLPGARTVADLQINSMQMGTSNATPTRSQTGLQSTPVVTKVLAPANVSKTSDGVYVFNVTMLTSEGNGSTFTEVGLFSNDGTMLSRQVHSPFLKDVTQTIQYTYTYVFS